MSGQRAKAGHGVTSGARGGSNAAGTALRLSVSEAADLAGVDEEELLRAVEPDAPRGSVSFEDVVRAYPVVRGRAHHLEDARGDAGLRRIVVLHENARLLRAERDEAQRARQELAEHLRASRSAREDAEASAARERTSAEALQARLVHAERRAGLRGVLAAGCALVAALVFVLDLRGALDPQRGSGAGAVQAQGQREAPAPAALIGPPIPEGYAPPPVRVAPPASVPALVPALALERGSLPGSAPVSVSVLAPEPEPEPEPEAPAVDERPLAPAGTGSVCRYSPSTSPGRELRALLGPCLGDWDAARSGTVGGHVVDGDPYCDQHVFLARGLGGSIERARGLAQLAEREGLAPPLVQLRVDRSAARFLKSRAGEWQTSGFEAGGVEDHRVFADSTTAADVWTVESWVLCAGPGGTDVARRLYRMRIELSDGPHADHLLAFEWLPAPR